MADTNDVKKLAELIKGIEIAMLTTVGDDGTLRSRPMATQQAEFDGVLWFFTTDSSLKAHDVERDAHVNLGYADPKTQRYVSVSGKAAIVHDRDKAKSLWNPLLKAYFPDGVDDPDLALLRVDVTGAEFWDAASSTMVHLIGLVKAVATGKRYAGEATEHGTIKM